MKKYKLSREEYIQSKIVMEIYHDVYRSVYEKVYNSTSENVRDGISRNTSRSVYWNVGDEVRKIFTRKH